MSQTLSDYIYSENNTILDNNEGTSVEAPSELIPEPSKKEICPAFIQKFAVCRKDNTVYTFTKGCGRHDCPVCRKEYGIKLFRDYRRIVAHWDPKRVHHMVFTTKANPLVSREYVQLRKDQFRKMLDYLISGGFVVAYGFYNMEVVYHAIGSPRFDKFGNQVGVYDESNYGYLVHFHTLFESDYVDLKKRQFSKKWKEITGDSYIIKLTNIRWGWDKKTLTQGNGGFHALRYLLKYVCKTEETSGPMWDYYVATKGMRYFNTFGKQYGGKFRFRIPYMFEGLEDVPELEGYYEIKSKNKRYCSVFDVSFEIKGKPQREKLDLFCYKCGSKLEYNHFSQIRRSFIFDSIPSFAHGFAMEPFSYVKLRYYVHMKNKKLAVVDIQQELPQLLISREEVLLSKVRHLLIDDHNAAAVEEVLGQDLFFLLSRGCLYQPRADKYEELK